MKKKGFSILIGLLVLVIVAVIIADYVSKSPDKRGDNPYALNIEDYSAVDPDLIHYKEIRNIPISNYKPGAIDVFDSRIWLAGENMLQVINIDGVQVLKKKIKGTATAIEVSEAYIFISLDDRILVFDHQAELLSEWETPGLNCVFSSLAYKEDVLYVADAGNRRVLLYDLNGTVIGEFEGKSESAAGHGFIIPSANFDIVVNDYGEFWAVNPGKHAIENYSDDGQLRGFWQNSAMNIEGFSGCCNPAEIAVMNDGSFVTSEKGMVRIKVYDSSGKLLSVVAPPDRFEEEGKAPEVAVDEDGTIYALDFDRSMIRIFRKN